MLGTLATICTLATAFQIGPFYQQKDTGYVAVRPLVAVEDDVTDVVWPVFTAHRDWWRFCYIVNWQTYPDDTGYQFSILPIWFNGRDHETGAYWGLFPIWGHHPHIATIWDIDFTLFPLYLAYERPRGREMLRSHSVLFPFFSWRSDGAWSFWPVYGVNYQRESDHRYVLWPLFTWASYREDRDTPGEGYSWMFFPLWAQIRREREKQDMFIPPFFSYATTCDRRGRESMRVRAPWPLFEYASTPSHRRISFWPLYERVVNFDFHHGRESSRVTRFGWKLIELYDDETRVFPFYASGRNHLRIWPFYETEIAKDGTTHSHFLSLFPIRWISAVDRNWAKFWTFYENTSTPLYTDHSLFWGIIRWRTKK